jgi:hypothetical protein
MMAALVYTSGQAAAGAPGSNCSNGSSGPGRNSPGGDKSSLLFTYLALKSAKSYILEWRMWSLQLSLTFGLLTCLISARSC